MPLKKVRSRGTEDGAIEEISKVKEKEQVMQEPSDKQRKATGIGEAGGERL